MNTDATHPDGSLLMTEAPATSEAAGDPVADAVRQGLTASPKWLPAWLFYDAAGSRLFERITVLPEYYLTRTERGIFAGYADGILAAASAVYTGVHGHAAPLRILELGAGTATKTGILLASAVRAQGTVQYLPIDVSASAIEEACSGIARTLSDVSVLPQVANYVTDTLDIAPYEGPTLALYIGSSIGNFSPAEAVAVLRNLRLQMRPGDSLLLGTDLVKSPETMIAAYNDSEGVTEAFNLNLLQRLNRELHAGFDLASFRHSAIWNAAESRMEMHLESTRAQTMRIPGLLLNVPIAAGETIHTENSYKFTAAGLERLLAAAGFARVETWMDERQWFAVTLAAAS